MFYCDDCAEVNGWPETLIHSRGKCECCNQLSACNDMPSKHLPPAKPTQAEIDAAIQSIQESS